MQKAGGPAFAKTWRRRAYALALALSCALPASSQEASVTRTPEGAGERLTFAMPSVEGASARADGRTLTISFASPADLDLVAVADALEGTGRFVRLSPDRMSLSLTLVRDVDVASGIEDGAFVVHLTPKGAAPAAVTVTQSLPAEQLAPPEATGTQATVTRADEPAETSNLSAPVVTASETEGYTRLTWEWPRPVTYSANLSEGELTLVFASPQEVRLTELRVHPPARVRSAQGAVTNGSFSARIGVAQGVALRHYSEGNLVVVDLVSPDAPPVEEQLVPEEQPASEGEAGHVAEGEEHASASTEEHDAASDAHSEDPPEDHSTEEPHGETTADDAAHAEEPAEAPGIAASATQDTELPQGETAATAPEHAEPSVPAPGTLKSMMELDDIDMSILDERATPEAAHEATAPEETAHAEEHTAVESSGPAPSGADHEAPAAAASEAHAEPREVPNHEGAPTPVDAARHEPAHEDHAEAQQSAHAEVSEAPAPAAEDTGDHETMHPPAEEPPAIAPAPIAEEAAAPELAGKAIAASATLGRDTVRIDFPWGEAVPAAVVRRGERLWIAFGVGGVVDLSALEKLRGEGVLGYRSLASDGATIVGLRLEQHMLATAVPSANGWTIALGDSILEPVQDVVLDPRTEADIAELAIGVKGALKIARFKDPDVNDDLILILSGADPQGLVSTRRFVDFELLATAQGLAIRPISDHLDVRTEPGYAVISRAGGLSLSGARFAANQEERIPQPTASPAEMNFELWRGPDNQPFDVGHKQHLVHVATSEDGERMNAQMDLAHFLLAREFALEALGVLNVMATETPAVTSNAHYRMMRGVANLMAGRIEDAKKDLDAHLLPDDPNAELWLAMLAATQEDWPKARVLFAKAEPAIVKLGAPWQARARIGATRAALAVNDVNAARLNLEFLPEDEISPEEAGEAKLLEAQLDEATGNGEQAKAIYAELVRSPIEPLNVRAQLARTRLAAKQGEISLNEAIDRLESLRYQWRGDQTEAEMLMALGDLYAELGDYRHALTTMKIAVRHFPGTPSQRRASQHMYDLFEDLYLDGKADEMPPVQALALYYDFKELTPVGPAGDVMIRHLSDRLVAMDLLDQATELLQHQVNNRLRGVARSQVAARLALVQLMNHKPEDALRTIFETRQSRLPETIASQRRLIEARALLDLNRYDHALDVISEDAGAQIDRLRADIYWHARDWGRVAPAIEATLEGTAESDQPLDEAQRFDIMRASIAYALGGDPSGLERMAEKFGSRMAGTPDEHAFSVVTSQNPASGVEIHTLAEQFASIDTLSAFLADLKAETDAPPSEAMN